MICTMQRVVGEKSFPSTSYHYDGLKALFPFRILSPCQTLPSLHAHFETSNPQIDPCLFSRSTTKI